MNEERDNIRKEVQDLHLSGEQNTEVLRYIYTGMSYKKKK